MCAHTQLHSIIHGCAHSLHRLHAGQSSFVRFVVRRERASAASSHRCTCACLPRALFLARSTRRVDSCATQARTCRRLVSLCCSLTRSCMYTANTVQLTYVSRSMTLMMSPRAWLHTIQVRCTRLDLLPCSVTSSYYETW